MSGAAGQGGEPVIALWGGVECTVSRVRDAYHDRLDRNGHARVRLVTLSSDQVFDGTGTTPYVETFTVGDGHICWPSGEGGIASIATPTR